eukprot:TRINITY_DN36475_c0_g1_i1.p1 TRINITY_DN36475_c0_g1~~TRINITY_DN36475_c0_g1_i1.p1  ORF type:complete len:399 (+),score=124.37 TRINITY_DN36475_c0_g1_i1:50-1198(+)
MHRGDSARGWLSLAALCVVLLLTFQLGLQAGLWGHNATPGPGPAGTTAPCDHLHRVPHLRPARTVSDSAAPPLARFPSFAPHPSFWVSCRPQSIRSMGWHWERENLTYALMGEILRSAADPVMVDVGANHGFFALYAAAVGARYVVAIEPQPRLVQSIRASAEANGWEGRIGVRNAAVALERTRVTMHRTQGDGGTAYAVYSGQGSAAAAPQSGASEEVDAVPLSEVLAGVPRISFMKIDVEGFEGVALMSALPLLHSRSVRNLVVEFGPPRRLGVGMRGPKGPVSVLNEGLRVLRSLSDSGYSLYVITGWCWKDYAALRERNQLPTGLGARVGCLEFPVMPVDPAQFKWFITEMRHECMLWWTLENPTLGPLRPGWERILQ